MRHHQVQRVCLLLMAVLLLSLIFATSRLSKSVSHLQEQTSVVEEEPCTHRKHLEEVEERCEDATTFKRARAVFLDDVCYPRSVSVRPKKRYVKDANVRIEIFQTQNWKSFYDIEWEEARNEDAVVKTFKDVSVWRQDDVSYFKGPTVWSYSHRCLTHREPEREPPSHGYVVVDEAVLSASEIWGEGYFHMLTEKIFMLGVARYLIEENPQVKIIFESGSNLVLGEFMTKILGVDPSRMIFQPQPFFVKKLHVPYYMTCGLQGSEHTRQTREWIREKNRELYLLKKQPTDIVLIHRSENGCNRCLSNSLEIIRALKAKFPQETVKLVSSGGMSLLEQMWLFSQTKILVAPHGAGLTNMIFLQDDARVVEIHNHPRYVNHVYYELAISLDLIYRGIAPLRLGEGAYDFNSGDIPKILLTVEELLQETVHVPPFPSEHLYKGKPDTMQGISD